MTVATLMYSSARDLGVRLALADRHRDLALAVGEPVEQRARPARGGRRRRRRRRGSISCRVTAGDSIASPAATSRTASTISAGGVSLSRKPPAPARSARSTWSSASNVVSTITCGRVVARRAAARWRRARPSAASGCPSARRPARRRRPRRPPRSPSATSATTRMSSAPAEHHRQRRRGPARRRRRSARGSARAHAGHGSQAAQPEVAARRPAVLEPAAGQADAARRGRSARSRRPGSRPRRRADRQPVADLDAQPVAGGAVERHVDRRAGACLRALVSPSCTIR